MVASNWQRAVERFESHLPQLDWSRQTQSRQGILEAFLRLATEHGFNSVSMRMIAREVEIKAPSLYAHFPDGRDEIVAEALRWHFSRFGNSLLEEIREVEDPREGWRRMVRLHVSRQLDLPESNLWDLLVATDAIVHFLPSGLRAEVDAWVDHYEGLYRAAAQDLGYGTAAQVTQLVRVAMTILEGANRWAAWDGKPRSLAQIATTADAVTFGLLEPHQ